MLHHRLIGIVCFVAFAAPIWAAPIDGTWKADVKSAKLPQKPDSYLLKNGSYSCETCTPPYTVKADGAFHPIHGNLSRSSKTDNSGFTKAPPLLLIFLALQRPTRADLQRLPRYY